MTQRTSPDELRDSVLPRFLPIAACASLTDDDSLFELLDSLGVLRLIVELELEFDIRIEQQELVPEHVGTLRSMASFIAKKLGDAYATLLH